MKIKQLLTKTLLVAVGLLAGQSAWADKTFLTSMTGNVGPTDLSGAWWTYCSKALTIDDGETYNITLVNHNTPTADYSHANFYIELSDESTEGYFDAQVDGGANPWGGTLFTDKTQTGVWSDSFSSETEWNAAYNGAEVIITVSRSGNVITANHVATCTDNNKTQFSGSISTTYTGNDAVKFYIVAAGNAYQTINKVTYTAADGKVTEYSTTSESCYVDQSNGTMNYNGASLTALQTYSCEHRVGNTTAAPVKVNGGGKIAFYKFDLSPLKAQEGTLENATFSVNLTGSGDGKYISTIRILGYNGTWDASTLTYNTMSNSAGSVGGTVTDGASFQPLANTDSESSGTSFPQLFSKGVKEYLQSAIDANKDYVTIAVIHNSARVANWATSASLEASFNTSAPTTYTIKFQDGNGNTLKNDVTYDTFAGNEYTASETDKAAFYSNDHTKKYTYSSGNETKTAVATAESNVITLIFSEGDNTQYTHTINAIGDVSKENIASVTLYEGLQGTIYYNKYIENEGNWYYTASNGNSGSSISYGVSVSAAGTTNKSYTSASITNFIEVEDMNKSRSWASEGTASRASNGKAPRIAQGGYAFTEPITDGGTFSITLGGRGAADNATIDLYVGTKSSNAEVTNMVSKGTFSKWSNGGITEITINDVVVEPGQVIVLKNPSSEHNCYVEADYIYYTKTASYNVSKTISTAGWATYCSPYALDLSNATGLTDAYIVTGGTGGVLAKTSVKDGTVPANTGLLLKGDAGTATIPVATSSNTNVTSNILVGVTEETKIAQNTGWVLMASPSLGFYQNANETEFTVGANTAYIPVSKLPVPAGARASYLFFDDMTGISKVAGSKVKPNGVIYNLNGQRVSNPTKGIYIIDGVKTAID